MYELVVPQVPSNRYPHLYFDEIFYNRGNNSRRDSACVICAEEITDSQITLRHRPCGNCFHISCGELALDKDRTYPTPRCPVCRVRLSRDRPPRRRGTEATFVTHHLEGMTVNVVVYQECLNLKSVLERNSSVFQDPFTRGLLKAAADQLNSQPLQPPTFGDPEARYIERLRFVSSAERIMQLVVPHVIVADARAQAPQSTASNSDDADASRAEFDGRNLFLHLFALPLPPNDPLQATIQRQTQQAPRMDG